MPTVTTTVWLALQEPVVPVMVYVVVTVGVAITVAPVLALKSPEGDHV